MRFKDAYEIPEGELVDIVTHTEEETNRELKRIHEECVKKYGDRLAITGKNTATCYQEIYEMGAIDEEDGGIIVEEDDGYCD